MRPLLLALSLSLAACIAPTELEPVCAPDAWMAPECPTADGVAVCPLEDGQWIVRCRWRDPLGPAPRCVDGFAECPDGAVPVCVDVPRGCVGHWP